MRPLTGSASLLSPHTPAHRGFLHTRALALGTASSVGLPSILSPAQHTAHDGRPPAPPERTHCARSLSHWSQSSARGQHHNAYIVAASSPVRWGLQQGWAWGVGGVRPMQRFYHFPLETDTSPSGLLKKLSIWQIFPALLDVNSQIAHDAVGVST